MDRFEKQEMPECKCATRILQDREGFVELGHFDKHFVKTQEINALQGNILELYLLDTLKTTFSIENLT